MSNMAHCRFENTTADLRDCLENIDADLSSNAYEFSARKSLIALCKEIAQAYEPDDWEHQQESKDEEDEE